MILPHHWRLAKPQVTDAAQCSGAVQADDIAAAGLLARTETGTGRGRFQLKKADTTGVVARGEGSPKPGKIVWPWDERRSRAGRILRPMPVRTATCGDCGASRTFPEGDWEKTQRLLIDAWAQAHQRDAHSGATVSGWDLDPNPMFNRE